jgi:hypothetical protein
MSAFEITNDDENNVKKITKTWNAIELVSQNKSMYNIIFIISIKKFNLIF